MEPWGVKWGAEEGLEALVGWTWEAGRAEGKGSAGTRVPGMGRRRAGAGITPSGSLAPT